MITELHTQQIMSLYVNGGLLLSELLRDILHYQR